MTRYFEFYCRYDDMATLLPAELYQPSPRHWHASVNIEGRMITWGGLGGDFQQIPASCMEVFDGMWQSIKTLGTPPTATVHSASTNIGSTAYNFGGWDGRGRSRSNALHSLTAGEWGVEEAQGPESRAGAQT